MGGQSNRGTKSREASGRSSRRTKGAEQETRQVSTQRANKQRQGAHSSIRQQEEQSSTKANTEAEQQCCQPQMPDKEAGGSHAKKRWPRATQARVLKQPKTNSCAACITTTTTTTTDTCRRVLSEADRSAAAPGDPLRTLDPGAEPWGWLCWWCGLRLLVWCGLAPPSAGEAG